MLARELFNDGVFKIYFVVFGHVWLIRKNHMRTQYTEAKSTFQSHSTFSAGMCVFILSCKIITCMTLIMKIMELKHKPINNEIKFNE